ncbi:MAG: ribosome silencing factor [Cellulosilyticaceae bacterium]
MYNQEVWALAQKLYDVIKQKKTENVEIIDVHEITSIADVFLIVTVSNTRMSKALADEIEFKMQRDDGIVVEQKEGYDSAVWILLDYGHVLVHILHTEAAEFYRLDRLWGDGYAITFEH